VRLSILDHGQRGLPRMAIRVIGRLSPPGLDDVAKTSLYRPSMFGRPWIRLLRQVMRGPSDWTPGERELFAAFTAHLNACPYCVGVHTATATLGLGSSIDVASLEDWRSGGFDPKVMAIFALLERVTLQPGIVTAADVEPARAAGISDTAITDALQVAYIMDVINRMANALGYSYGDEPGRQATAKALHRIGYRLPGFLLRS
jgi:uncharacterized peroxidase-related enzyme